MKKEPKSTKGNLVDIIEVNDISPHNKALYEAGKVLLVESISTTRQYCQSMIGYSTGAIPIYLSILTFILPKNYSLGLLNGIILALPAILFLVSSVIFAIGYLPISTDFSLDIVEEIEKERGKIIDRRGKIIKVGASAFVLSALLAIIVVIVSLGIR